ncbi:MAG: leucine-rich repeat domain-containing protein [Clostridia bacterium]|nr:leucine-rich repeat domain-containing protein [Clostridia bacterium]
MKKLAVAALSAACIISAAAFAGCNSGEAAVNYKLSEDGTHYIVSGVTGNLRALTEYDVPSTYCEEEGGQALPVTEIGDDAFMNCTRLAKVTIPDTVTRIGARAFVRCAFTSFTIPESVTVIESKAFFDCGYLEEITIPHSVKSLGEMAFYSCTSLKSAYVKAEIETLEPYTFYNSVYGQGQNVFYSTSLTKVYLPASLKKIHITALQGNLITDIYFAGTEEQWDELYFYEMVAKKVDGKETDEKEEKRFDKKDVVGTTEIHKNSEF